MNKKVPQGWWLLFVCGTYCRERATAGGPSIAGNAESCVLDRREIRADRREIRRDFRLHDRRELRADFRDLKT